MNQKELWSRRNAAWNALDRFAGNVRDSVRISKGVSDQHEEMKYKICRHLCKQDKSFVTEAVFKDGMGRADILCLDDHLVIEILYSESVDSCKEKVKRYPPQFRVVMVNAENEFKPELLS